MTPTVSQLIHEYQVHYEVSPYYIVLEEGHGTTAATKKRIQAGFDIDVYGEARDYNPGRATDYALGYFSLREMVERISPHTGDACSIEVIPFGSAVFLDIRNNLRPEAMFRIRVSHHRGVGLPAEESEEHALEEIERELQTLGIGVGRAKA
jgi:hypothetical protein